MNLKKYFRIWCKTTLLSAQSQMATIGASLMYLVGKFVRFGLFLGVIYITIGKTSTLLGYDIQKMVLFFLVFNLMDILGQLFFRGIYWFRHEVVSGKLDFTLVKPANVLFLVLTKWTDLLDLPLLVVVAVLILKYSLAQPLINLFLFAWLVVFGFIMVMALHILIAAIGVLTTEVDHTVWIYRDLSLLARMPIDIYASWIRVALTFIIPVGLVFTFPAKALMGILSWQGVLYTTVASCLFFAFSLWAWHQALLKYSSASS